MTTVDKVGSMTSLFSSAPQKAVVRRNPVIYACYTLHLAMQVNGKLRATVELPNDATQAQAEAAAKGESNIVKFLDGQEIKKIVFVPGRILNFIVPGGKKK